MPLGCAETRASEAQRVSPCGLRRSEGACTSETGMIQLSKASYSGDPVGRLGESQSRFKIVEVLPLVSSACLRWGKLSQLEETTGGRVGQTWLTLKSPSGSSATYCSPSIKVRRVRFSACSLAKPAPLSIALQPEGVFDFEIS